MSSIRFDRVLVNPSSEQIDATVTLAVAAANKGARSRLVEDFFVPAVAATAQGYTGEDGGGVPNRYMQVAETSVVGVAWFTDAAGAKHVRIYGDRVPARKSAYAEGGGCNLFGFPPTALDALHPCELVYPALRVVRYAKSAEGDDRVLRGVLADVIAAPLDADLRAVAADKLDDLAPADATQYHPFRRTARELREAAAVLRSAGVRFAAAAV